MFFSLGGWLGMDFGYQNKLRKFARQQLIVYGHECFLKYRQKHFAEIRGRKSDR